MSTPHAWIFALFMVTFAVGTDDFVVAGALPSISHDLGVSEGTAGQLVTAFSLAYAVSAPLMAAATSRLAPRRLLGWGLLVFAALNLATALAPTFGALLAMRVVTAVVAGTLTPAAFAVAGHWAAPGRAGRAIGGVAAGLTVSLAVGVPIGTWLSTQWGWQSTFLAVGAFSLVACATVLAALPRRAAPTTAPLAERLRALRRPVIVVCIATTTVGACAGLMPYTFVAPVSASLSGRPDLLTVFIAAVGIAGAGGAYLGGRITDAWGPDRGMIATFSTSLVATAALTALAWATGAVGPLPILALLAIWGVGAWANNAPMNARTLTLAGPAGTEAIALNTSGLYVGIAAGSAMGGFALDSWGVGGLLGIALGVGLVAVVVMVVGVRRWPVTP